MQTGIRLDGSIMRYDKDSTMVRSHMRILFYRPGRWLPWWLRACWHPQFSHVAIEPIEGAIHDLPKDRAAAWWHTAAHWKERPPDRGIVIPMVDSISPDSLAHIIAHIGMQYDDQRIEKVRCVLWQWRLWRRRRPRSCVTLATLWLKLTTDIQSEAVTPDELYADLKGMRHGLER